MALLDDYTAAAEAALRELAGIIGVDPDVLILEVRTACMDCRAPIRWHADEPTGQAPGWRHVDQAASYEFGAHRARPGGCICFNCMRGRSHR